MYSLFILKFISLTEFLNSREAFFRLSKTFVRFSAFSGGLGGL